MLEITLRLSPKDGDKVRLFYAAEMPVEAADPGQDPLTAPDIAQLWNILDVIPEGCGTDWYPKLSYEKFSNLTEIRLQLFKL